MKTAKKKIIINTHVAQTHTHILLTNTQTHTYTQGHQLTHTQATDNYTRQPTYTQDLQTAPRR